MILCHPLDLIITSLKRTYLHDSPLYVYSSVGFRAYSFKKFTSKKENNPTQFLVEDEDSKKSEQKKKAWVDDDDIAVGVVMGTGDL